MEARVDLFRRYSAAFNGTRPVAEVVVETLPTTLALVARLRIIYSADEAGMIVPFWAHLLECGAGKRSAETFERQRIVTHQLPSPGAGLSTVIVPLATALSDSSAFCVVAEAGPDAAIGRSDLIAVMVKPGAFISPRSLPHGHGRQH